MKRRISDEVITINAFTNAKVYEELLNTPIEKRRKLVKDYIEFKWKCIVKAREDLKKMELQFDIAKAKKKELLSHA